MERWKDFLHGNSSLKDILIERRRMYFLNQDWLDESIFVHGNPPKRRSGRKIIPIDAQNDNSDVDVAVRTSAALAVRSEQVHLRQPIALTTACLYCLAMLTYCRHGSPSDLRSSVNP